jgi:ribosomal protein S25
MMTAQEFAKKKKVSIKVARSRLAELESEGLMRKKIGPSGLHLYYEVKPMCIKWHDPFNRIGRKYDS